MEQDQEAPKIEFPCAYPIKIIGDSAEGDVARIIQVVRDHAPEVTPDQVTTRKSREIRSWVYQAMPFFLHSNFVLGTMIALRRLLTKKAVKEKVDEVTELSNHT